MTRADRIAAALEHWKKWAEYLRAFSGNTMGRAADAGDALAALLREPQPESNPSMASNSSPPYRLPETKSIKCQQPYFDAILSGEKTFEIRKNDRDYRAGDRLNLREWDDDAGEYTGREQAVDVLYRMPGGRWGIPADYCVMSIRLVQPEPALDYLGNAIGEEPSDSQPAPVVGDDDAALLAKTQDWLCHNLTVTPDSHYRNVQALLERCSAALADVARLTEKYDDARSRIASLDEEVEMTRAALATAEEAQAKAVAEEREACRMIAANYALNCVDSAGRFAANTIGERIRARAGRNDAG